MELWKAIQFHWRSVSSSVFVIAAFLLCHLAGEGGLFPVAWRPGATYIRPTLEIRAETNAAASEPSASPPWTDWPLGASVPTDVSVTVTASAARPCAATTVSITRARARWGAPPVEKWRTSKRSTTADAVSRTNFEYNTIVDHRNNSRFWMIESLFIWRMSYSWPQYANAIWRNLYEQ